jgi:hypothetical protein
LKWKKLRPKYPTAVNFAATKNERGRFEFEYDLDIGAELEALREGAALSDDEDDIDDGAE